MAKKMVSFEAGRMKKVGDTDTVEVDGSITLGNADTDNIVFSGEVDSDIIPDDHDTYDLGSATKRWSQIHATTASFEDVIQVELTIPGLDVQTDSNAYTFYCPYNLDVESLAIVLSNPSSSGSVTVALKRGGDTLVSASITASNYNASSSSVTNGGRTEGDDLVFDITAAGTGAQGLVALLYFRRRM